MSTVINQPTNQQEEAITTITSELAAEYAQFTPDTEVNKRLKVAQMAKQFKITVGVLDAQVGTVKLFTQDREYAKHEVVQVTYSPTCEEAVREAAFSLYVTRAWFTKDELYAVEFSTIGEEVTHLMFNNGWQLRFLSGDESITIAGQEQDDRKVRQMIHTNLGYEGDQYANALKATADRAKADAKEAEHQARVRAAYAEREASGGHYRTAWCLEKAHGGLAAADADGWKRHREAFNLAYKTMENLYHVELWAIVESSLGKLRCETNITNGDEPYGFVTMADVAYHIITKWVNNGYWDSKEMRRAVADEFISKHLS